ncbi:long-chain-fatty-acid--CoA ligase [Pseudonocardia hispaniensis]|uniref:Long-chain-fatty-acid--CoA ligase n=1 Tax=Pseudonocardia hispaniensis TaxID=904933 RepID=A0ABW1J903_9PSEU
MNTSLGTGVRGNIGDGDLTVTNILRHGATWHSGRSITTVGDEAAHVTFGEFACRVAALAHGLRSLGVRAGFCVGSLLWNTRTHLEAYFAVPSMGGLLHTINPRLSPDQIAYTINHAADEVLLVDASLLGHLAQLRDRVPSVRTIVVVGPYDGEALAGWPGEVLGYDELVSGRPTEFLWPTLDERSAATLCYTTGTTGDPKGVAYSHRSIWIHALSLCTANAVAVSSRDRGYIIVPMFHANAWGYPFANFWAGGDLLLCNRHLDPPTVVEAIRNHRPTYSNGVPTVWNEILSYLDADPSRDLGSLDRIVLGGAPIPQKLRTGLKERYGVNALQGWGMTETSPLVTLNRQPWAAENPDPDRRAGGQGRVLAGVEIRLVQPDTGTVLPADGETVGELELRGPWIADSYFRTEASDKFRDGWLRTGDVGTLDALGYVNLTDRAKDVIKSGGEWISSVRLELEIAKHPDVLQAAVIGVPDSRWDERPCALVVLREDSTTSVDDLWQRLREEDLPRWWVPERWVVLNALPMTSVGKFDKRRMRAMFAKGDLEIRQFQES